MRRAWWEECTVNVTSIAPHVYLTSFESLWATITVSATATCAVTYLIAGIIASCLTSPRKTFYWLPLVATLLGGLHGFIAGATFAAITSFMYMSLPYAVDNTVAISLGVGLAVVLTYAALGRQYNVVTPSISSDY